MQPLCLKHRSFWLFLHVVVPLRTHTFPFPSKVMCSSVGLLPRPESAKGSVHGSSSQLPKESSSSQVGAKCPLTTWLLAQVIAHNNLTWSSSFFNINNFQSHLEVTKALSSLWNFENALKRCHYSDNKPKTTRIISFTKWMKAFIETCVWVEKSWWLSLVCYPLHSPHLLFFTMLFLLCV